ncbi:MAG: hypothetical protein RIR26_133 [Pseudomonadota bacterium]
MTPVSGKPEVVWSPLKMPKIARTLVGFGFLWMSAWATFGALLGARLNQALLTDDAAWLKSVNRELFRSAHAHMNGMALVLVGVGLSYTAARRRASERTLTACSMSILGATVIFGTGLMLEAFFPPERGTLPWASALTAIGGVVHLLATGLWGVLFLGRGPQSAEPIAKNV